MNQSLRALRDDVDRVDAAWSSSLPAFGFPTGFGADADAGTGADVAAVADSAAAAGALVQAQLESMSDAGVVAAMDALGRLSRGVNWFLTRAAAEVARRSAAELGREGLARQQGFGNAARLVASSTGAGVGAAMKLVSVGEATATGLSFTGEVLPAKHQHVAAALSAGSIGVDAAAAITTMLDRVAPRADPGQADGVEEVLAARAADLPLDVLYRLIKEAEARLDPDGVAPAEAELHASRMLLIRDDPHGGFDVKGHFDAEGGAPVKAAIEAIVTHSLRTRHDGAGESGTDGGDAMPGPVVEDTRTVPQLQADALSMIAAHALGCERVPAAPSTTLVVRTDLDTLVEGVGYGMIDGIGTPISAGTIRKLAASAGIIPMVLGTDSLPLDLGRTARLYLPGQRIALGERDGGCACCGLGISYTQAHHIRWWERDTGPTNLDNGVLLCPPCHTRVHNDGWTITLDERHQVWFTPPPHVDITQKPRLGGKARFGLPTLAHAA